MSKRTPIEGTILRLRRDCIILDLGRERRGIINHEEMRAVPRHELEQLRIGSRTTVYLDAARSVAHGQEIKVFWYAIDERDAWALIAECEAEGTPISVPIIDARSKGLLTGYPHLGGFLPYSQIKSMQSKSGSDLQRLAAELVGQTVQVQVREFDPGRRRLIFTQLGLAEEQQAAALQAFLENTVVGDVLAGTVVGVESFGLFVDVGPLTGLVHISEIAWTRVDDPADYGKPGDTVRVKVIKLDRREPKLALSMRALQENPWERFAAAYQPGAVLKGTVGQVLRYGLKVDLGLITGLLHRNRLPAAAPADLNEWYTADETIDVRLVSLDAAQQRAELEPAGGSPSGGAHQPAQVDLNRADRAALLTLPGVGPVLAAAILERRAAIGRFRSPSDLGTVRGVGDALLRRLAPHVTVGE